MEKIKKLIKYISDSNNIVFFGGAGVSTESGLKDFRSNDGLYKLKLDRPVEEFLSSRLFYKNTEEFYFFYKKYMNCLKYKPNTTHFVLKKLEDMGKLTSIITQNIDGLHQKAGSKNICEIHGSVLNNHCLICNKFYSGNYVFSSNGVPKCSCGGIIKPDVTLYGEMLPNDFSLAQKYIFNCDLLIVAGTSLTVEPAASLINLFKGKYKVLINKDKTMYDNEFDIVINDSIGKVFEEIEKEICN